MRTQQVKERAITLAGDTAGAVADPKTGLSKLRTKVSSPALLLVAVALVVAYVIGRRTGRHDG